MPCACPPKISAKFDVSSYVWLCFASKPLVAAFVPAPKLMKKTAHRPKESAYPTSAGAAVSAGTTEQPLTRFADRSSHEMSTSGSSTRISQIKQSV